MANRKIAGGAHQDIPERAPESRFSDRVNDYVRCRPGYPAPVLTLLQREAALSNDSKIADIGSGTGISTCLLLQAGCDVFAVEPNRAMREAAERQLEGHPHFHSIDGKAQATTLPNHSVDLVVAAQSFHWFDTLETRSEFNRILKPCGKAALIWNERSIDSTPFLKDYERLLLEFGTDYSRIRHENTGRQELDRFFRQDYQSFEFANSQECDFNALHGRLLSSSYIPPIGHPLHGRMIDELQQIFTKHEREGLVEILYATRVHIGSPREAG